MTIAIRMFKTIVAIAFHLFAGLASAQAPAVQLQVGKTFYMQDGTTHTIVGVTDTRPRIFRSDLTSKTGWFANGTPSTSIVDRDGSKSLFGPLPAALVEKLRTGHPRPVALPNLPKVLIEYDPNARTVRLTP
jgi:hypothetical protein